MSKNAKKRLAIFKKYVRQLGILQLNQKLHGAYEEPISNYICPLCLEFFSENDLDQNVSNPLTLEDAPPKSLGGKANTLTCKACNNNMGREIDSQLALRLTELDKRRFLPNTKSKVKIVKGELVVQGTIEVDETGKIRVIHSEKNNHSQRLQEFIKTVDPNSENPYVSVEFPEKTFDSNKLQYAILKTAYLLVFQRFGYMFILDKVYNKLREQLLYPNKKIYPTKFWFEAPYPKEMCGVHIIKEKRMESIMVIFPLVTGSKERIITAILPLPFNSISKILKELNKRFNKEKRFFLKADSFNPKGDYLNDYSQMKLLFNWLARKSRRRR